MSKSLGVNKVEEGDLFAFLHDKENFFDMIVANDLIEHLSKEEIFRLLDAIYQALKPQGTVLVSTLNAASLFGAETFFIDFTHETGFTPISLAQVLRVCGFEDVEVHGEKPTGHDARSKLRRLLWAIVAKLLLAFIYVERGYGRSELKMTYIFEPRMFAVAYKPT